MDGTVVHLETIGMGGSLTDEKPKEAPSAKDDGVKKEDAQNGDNETKTQETEPAKIDTPKQEQKAEPKPEAPKDLYEVSPEDIASLTSLAGEQFAKDIVNIYQSIPNATPETYKITATAAATSDRSARGKIHHEVRRIFASKIDTSTNEDGAIVAKLVPTRGRKRNRDNRANPRAKQEKPAGEYLHFTLFKDNRDTMDAVNQVARMLRVKPQVIGYSGTKDRRASTAQRCSIRYTRDRALASANKTLRGVVTGDYVYKEQPIVLGQHRGNEFVITIKNCKILDDTAASKPIEAQVELLKTNLQSAIDHLTQHGWINYFGHQRFGTHTIGTHEVGRLILGEKYEEAVEALLHYDEHIANNTEAGDIPEDGSAMDDALRHQACMLFRTGKDPDRAEQIMPRRFSAEVCLLRQLNREGKKSSRDFVGAIIHITRGMRTMYLHAYQSHVWNHAVSKRWELHGDKVVEGDLVLAEKQSTSAPATDQDDNEIINPNDDQPDEDTALEARPLTASEASSGKYTINDVVLPTPGYEVIYPSNTIGQFYTDFMAKPENGSLDPHKMRRMRREFSVPGRYRKVMNGFIGGRPSVEVRTYGDDKEQMHPTDLDGVRERISRNKAERGPKRQKTGEEDVEMKNGGIKEEKAEGEGAVKVEEEEKETEQPADKIAVIVKFQLGSSAYATVTLRELMGDPPEEPNA